MEYLHHIRPWPRHHEVSAVVTAHREPAVYT